MTDHEDLSWQRLVTAFADSGGRARAVLDTRAVVDAWSEDSVLPRMTVGAVAGHLVAVLIRFEHRYDAEVPTGAIAQVSAPQYGAVRFERETDLDGAAFSVPREGAERVAARGHAAAVARFDACLDHLVNGMRADPPDRPLANLDGATATTLRSYLVTRLVEIVVHTDDLAESVGLECPPPSRDAADVAIGYLAASARRRAGDVVTLRALTGRADPDALRAL